MKETDITRAKILGVLIQDARKYARRTIEECAEVLGISPEHLLRPKRANTSYLSLN